MERGASPADQRPERLIHRLRAATGGVHRHLESLPHALAMREGTVSLERYGAFLRSMHTIHLALERALESADWPGFGQALERAAERRTRLEADLSQLSLDPFAVDGATLRALVLAQQIRLGARQEPLRVLGYLYVLEGSQLGGLVLHPVLARRQEFRRGGLAYLAGTGKRTRRRFGQFLAQLERSLDDERSAECAVAGALSAFEGLVAVFESLDPGRGAAPRLLGELNRDAGTHAIPSDVREIEAALEAGEATWHDYAYFGARYGERGMRFTRSDSAWLVTLAREDPRETDRHVRWLARVLACRGMPRLLLEHHLETLHRYLVERLPERAARYGVLQGSAEALRGERENALAEHRARELVSAFADGQVNEHGIAPREAGSLLLAAIADERCGIGRAVSSLESWLADPNRFSSRWVAAARTLVRDGRVAS